MLAYKIAQGAVGFGIGDVDYKQVFRPMPKILTNIRNVTSVDLSQCSFFIQFIVFGWIDQFLAPIRISRCVVCGVKQLLFGWRFASNSPKLPVEGGY